MDHDFERARRQVELIEEMASAAQSEMRALLLHSLERVRTLVVVIGLLLCLLQVILILVARSLDTGGQFAQLAIGAQHRQRTEKSCRVVFERVSHGGDNISWLRSSSL